MSIAQTSAPQTEPVERQVVLSARDIVVEYRSAKGAPVRAVRGVDLDLLQGETLGVVGESGCGKSSLGKSLVQLPPPTSGEVMLAGQPLTGLSQRRLRPLRRRIQLVFQDPISSLNPRRTALEIVADPLRLVGHPEVRKTALAALEDVGVDERMADRRPHELSGGQCQRISIARAVVQNPEVLICDEPVSALDVSVQAAVLNLLEKMKAEHHLSMIFISHDLAVVKNISDRVAVMYLGKICELAPATALYARPLHHYTTLLLDSIPNPGAERKPRRARNEISRKAPSAGCPFAARCPAATELCHTTEPELVELEPGHQVACHHPVSTPQPVG
ncbi:ABC transporter ATP-binding protein [Nocardioides sp. cx-173]|uniref:oligopeptide/dipeptide ABC transporter ATP-binding protein n=1 Tax=Nocardioides sp. cx-173 TaxID=2898796 RepID=UPI001E4A5C31|nr:ABC transporter ATP-binding protein [Nocardioides sp. cx-173]MCD4526584.1 ABC transporter ATP-binding protein [Nocardioides sp. cx-173]UGB40679.1 ABC transporter ATP-binding protein [Nocardioides sp. cx-173]